MDFINNIEDKYPKELLENRLAIEGCVIGCIYKDILCLDEIQLEQDYFITTDGRFYYLLAQHLRQKNFNTLDEVTIVSNVPEKIQKQFYEKGGFETIQNFVDIISINNLEGYVESLYRENMLLNLYNKGFNLLNEIEYEGKTIQPLKEFRKLTTEQIVDFYEGELSGLACLVQNKSVEEEVIEFDDAFIEGLKEGEANGVPFDIYGTKIVDGEEKTMYCLPYLSQHIQGLMPGTTSMIGGYSSTGKSTLLANIVMALIYRGEKVIIGSNEQQVKPFKIQFLCWVIANRLGNYKIHKKKILNGDLTTEEFAYVKKAQEIWNRDYKGKIKFVRMVDADMSVFKKKVRQAVLKEGYTVAVYDTLKADLSGEMNNLWIKVLSDSRQLDIMAKQYNIIMLASIQLAMNTSGTLFLDASVLSMSKQVVEVLENLLLIRNVYETEFDEKSKWYCRPFKWKKNDDGKWVEEKYVPTSTGNYRMLFVAKCRNGENSTSSGQAQLLSFNGSMGIFGEAALCKPQYGKLQG